MSRWFLDTEFNEDGRTIELISIALVAESGAEYYAVSSEFDPDACNEWVKANVLPKLPPRETWKPRAGIAAEIRGLLLASGKPEIWAYFADYDWVALCQLYGPMVALPKGFPFWCRDLKQLMSERGIEKSALPAETNEHDALADARWVRDSYAHVAESRANSRHELAESERAREALKRLLERVADLEEDVKRYIEAFAEADTDRHSQRGFRELAERQLAESRANSAAMWWIPCSEAPKARGQFIGRYETPGGVTIQPVGYNPEWGWWDSEYLTHWAPMPIMPGGEP